MRIFLTGMPGCGKSFWGKKLSSFLNFSFIDLDHEIETDTNKTITQLFQEEGEETFRKIESKVLLQIIQSKNSFVMATGGGTPCFFRNLEWMKESGFVVYLNEDLDILLKRIRFDSTNSRPLFNNLNDEDLKLKLNELYHIRKVFYENCTFSIDMKDIEEEKFLTQFIH